MTNHRNTQEFLDLQAAAAEERYVVARARKEAAEMIERASYEAHTKTLRAARALLEAGASEYMVGQAANVNGYHQRSRLAQEAREAIFQEGTTAESFVITNLVPGEEAIYTVTLDTGREVYVEFYEGELLNAPDTHGNIEDGLAILDGRGFTQEVLDEIQRLRAS